MEKDKIEHIEAVGRFLIACSELFRRKKRGSKQLLIKLVPSNLIALTKDNKDLATHNRNIHELSTAKLNALSAKIRNAMK